MCTETLFFTDIVKYLGIQILWAFYFVIDIDKLEAKFYVALSSLLSKSGSIMNGMVIIHLFRSFCYCIFVTVSLYVDSHARSFNRIYWILFQLNDIQFITDIQRFMNHLSISRDLLIVACDFCSVLELLVMLQCIS